MNLSYNDLSLHMEDYFNIHAFYNDKASAPELAATHIVNSAVDAVNKSHRLPKFLVVILDKDILSDFDLFASDAVESIAEETSWVVKQIQTAMKHRRSSVTDQKPGAVYADDPKIIFVRMIRRVESHSFGKTLNRVFELRPKFNDSLNEAVRRIDQYILTINSCNSPDHFTHEGELSEKGHLAFWKELDNLVDRFDNKKIKLLPTPPHTSQFNPNAAKFNFLNSYDRFKHK